MAGTRNYDFLVSVLSRPEDTSQFTQPTCPTDQTPADRRLGRGKIMLPPAIQRGLLYPVLHHHHRYRLQDPHNRIGWQAGEAADLGHGGPRTL